MRRKAFLLILLLFLFRTDPIVSSISTSLIKNAALKCCAPSKFDCCVDMLTFGKPIGCGYEKWSDWARLLYRCAQSELFGEEDKEKRMELDDGVCCQVFTSDHNDAERRCDATCRMVMQSPSLDKSSRIQMIRQCKLDQNPLFECFEKCRQLRVEGIHIEVLHFNEYCNSTLLVKNPEQILEKKIKIIEDIPNDDYQK